MKLQHAFGRRRRRRLPKTPRFGKVYGGRNVSHTNRQRQLDLAQTQMQMEEQERRRRRGY